MWWLLIPAAWLVVGVPVAVYQARAWYARQFALHLSRKEELERYHNHYCGSYWCSCPRPEYQAPPTRGEAAWAGVVDGALWPIFLSMHITEQALGKIGGLTFAGIEEKVKTDHEAERQMKKLQFIEQFRAKLDGLAFAKALATRPGEVANHNHEVALLIQDMKGHRDSPLTTQELEDLAEMYRAPEGLRVKEVTK